MDKTQKYANKIIHFLCYTLALFPILPRGMESILMITLFTVSVFYFICFKTKKTIKVQWLSVIVFSLLFFVYGFSLCYSSNLESGLNYLVKVIPILVFPLIFGIFIPGLLAAKQVKNIFTIYVISIFSGLIFIQVYLFATVDVQTLTNWEYRNAFESLTDVHGKYYSIWIAFGLLICFFRLLSIIKTKSYIQIGIISLIIGYLIYWQLKLGARFPQILTLIFICVLVFFKIKKKKHKLLGLIGVAVFISSIVLFKPNFVNRLHDLANYNFSLPQGDYNYDFGTITNEQIRNGIYFCSFKLIRQSWGTGYGIGDVDEQLQQCYDTELESNVYTMFNYNSHNQYLHLILAAGIFGLILFLISLLFSVYLAYKKANTLYLFFSVFIILSLLTENVLSRHDGILFFSFFNAIFAFTNRKQLIFFKNLQQ